MRRIVLASTLALVAGHGIAGPFDQIHSVEMDNKRAEAAAQAERQRQADAARAQQDAREEKLRRERLAAEQKARQVQKARQEEQQRLRLEQAGEEKRLRARDEQYEDTQRELQLEEAKLKLQMLKAKAARSNEYIDAELRESAAHTDVIQSGADATRNVSSGAKSLLEDSGEAEVNRSKKLFE